MSRRSHLKRALRRKRDPDVKDRQKEWDSNKKKAEAHAKALAAARERVWKAAMAARSPLGWNPVLLGQLWRSCVALADWRRSREHDCEVQQGEAVIETGPAQERGGVMDDLVPCAFCGGEHSRRECEIRPVVLDPSRAAAELSHLRAELATKDAALVAAREALKVAREALDKTFEGKLRASTTGWVAPSWFTHAISTITAALKGSGT